MGRVQVHGTGVDDVHLPTIADPVALQRSIQEAMGTLTPAANPARRRSLVDRSRHARSEKIVTTPFSSSAKRDAAWTHVGKARFAARGRRKVLVGLRVSGS